MICKIINRGRVLEVTRVGRNNDYCLFVDGAPASRSETPDQIFRSLASYVDDEDESKNEKR